MDSTEVLEYGHLKIADDVIAAVAGLAAIEIEGVAGMSGGFTGELAEILGKKNLSKGVKVEINDKSVKIDLYIIVEYGAKIPHVAWEIQDNVKKAIEKTTGLKAVEVNIHIQGVKFPKQPINEDLSKPI